MSLIVYGIKNCNTVKSALNWLQEHSVDYEFHDFKSKGVTVAKLKDWADQVGWENLVNKRGMTWRQLPPEVREKITSASAALPVLKEKTSMIKRPILEVGDKVIAMGFDAEHYKRVLN